MNNNLKLYSILLIIALIFLLKACDDGPTDPEVEPGRRDYTWSIDTLVIPFTFLHGIWGSSPTDIWSIGPGGDLDKTIFHFDGEEWSNDSQSRSISPQCIWGFEKNDIWLGGQEGRIWHFDGNTWYEHLHLQDPKFIYSGFEDIWGESNENLFAVGFLDSMDTRKSLIYHYDGNLWKRINIKYDVGNLIRIRRGKKTNNNYYIIGLKESTEVADTTMILEFDGNKITKTINKTVHKNLGGNFVQEIDDRIYFTINGQLFTYSNRSLQPIIKNPYPNDYQATIGRNQKDIFWFMQDGIAHYNGENIEYILNLYGSERLTEGMIFENDIYFLAVDISHGLNIIYHGYLLK